MSSTEDATSTGAGGDAAGIAASQPLAGPAPGRRVDLDVLRGFALLGIFAMNIEYFPRAWDSFLAGVPAALEGIDRAAGLLVYLFVQGKFWTLFSWLFGIGFALMHARSGDRPGFVPTYLRRLLVLLVIGLLHSILLWPGDILVSYALSAAIMLLCFRNMSVRGLLVAAVVSYLLPVMLMLVSVAVVGLAPGDEAGSAAQAAAFAGEIARNEAVYAQGSWSEITRERLHETLVALAGYPFGVGPGVVGMFLLGAAFVRAGVIDDPARHRRLLRRVLWICLPSGLLLVAASASVGVSFPLEPFPPDAVLALAVMTLANPLVMLGYACGLLLGLQQAKARRVLGVLAPAGQMALTNYLTQSLVAGLLFFGYGLGLGDAVPRSGQLVLVLAVFALQVAFSHWWLARFRWGPLEWVWRSLSLWQALPLRRVA